MTKATRYLTLTIVILLLLALSACGLQGDQRLAREENPPTATPLAANFTPSPSPETPPTVAPVPQFPPEVEEFAHEWPMANKDYENSRYTTDSGISAGNVHELGVAWALPLNAAGDWGAAASNPLIAGGVVYFQDLQSNTVAIDLQSGQIIWQKVYHRASLGPNGPALGYGKIFIQDGVNNIIALDSETGAELWSTELGSSTGTHQPAVFDGYVYTGTGAGIDPGEPEDAVGRTSYTGGVSGIAYGLDQDNGTIIWSLWTVEEGFWGNPELNGGGALWFPPAIDTENGTTFWGTGNPAPFPGTLDYPNASSRPGPNLYTNSMLAIDGHDGQMLWYNQVKPHDLFDLDFQNAPILTTAAVDGEERALVIGSGKLGRVLAFDRETGETVWETWVGEHQNDTLQSIPMDEVVEVIPGVWGGVETPKALADGIVYVPVANVSTPWTATGWDASNSAEAVVRAEARTRVDEGTGELVAIEVDTGEVIWITEFDQVLFSGATAVNDLVFTATLDGVIHALSREDGSVVWRFQAPGGIIAWPAIAGDTIVWPVGLGREPVLLALRLGASGTVAPPAGRAVPSPAPTPDPSPTPLSGGE